MKNKLLILSVMVLMAGTTISGCQSSATKVENAEDKLQDARENVVTAKQELNQAMKDSIQKFRMESEETIRLNEVQIAEFKVKVAKENSANRARHEKHLAELERQNNDLKSRLREFSADQQENWDTFRAAFKSDMKEFGNKMKDFWGRK